MTTTTFNTAKSTLPVATRNTSLLSFILLALAARRQRAALGRLDTSALDDIGLTRKEATAEASRSIWDVPSNWRQ